MCVVVYDDGLLVVCAVAPLLLHFKYITNVENCAYRFFP